MKPINWEKKLNPEQLKAVRHKDGPLLILAGAGSGKTRVIVHRIAHLITVHGVPASQILAVSFTNRAAEEMKERIRHLIGEHKGLMVSTFHSFCVRLLRRDIGVLERKTNFTIYDTDDQQALIKRLLREAGEDDSREGIWSALGAIGRAKNLGLTPEQYALQAEKSGARMKFNAQIYAEYQRSLLAFNAVDFDDLLVYAVEVLKRNEEIRRQWSERCRYIMVDEYQDTNAIQLELLKLLCSEHRNLAVVGDDDQAIYGWRGAEVSNILDFEKNFAPCQVVQVEQNYRSTTNILETANHIILNNHERHPKRLWSTLGDGPPAEIHTLEDEEAEAQFVAAKIGEHLAEYGKYSDFAILYRTNSQSRALEDALRYSRIPYRIIGGMQFYERKEVRDLLAYLRLAVNPNDEASLLRILNFPARGVGKTTQLRLNQLSGQRKTGLWEMLGKLDDPELEITGKTREALKRLRENIQKLHEEALTAGAGDLAAKVEETFGLMDEARRTETEVDRGEARADNIRELVDTAIRYSERAEEGEDTLGHFLERIALVDSFGDKNDGADRNATVLMTLHSAKGLEFPAVFLVGMEEELMPHRRSVEENRVDEERRLCYVGITRAQHRLFLTRPKVRFYYGKPQPRAASRFLAELPEEEKRVKRIDWTGSGEGRELSAEELSDDFFRRFGGG